MSRQVIMNNFSTSPIGPIYGQITLNLVSRATNNILLLLLTVVM